MRLPDISRGFCDIKIFLVVFSKLELEPLDSSAAHFCQVFDEVEHMAGLQARFTIALAADLLTKLKEIVWKIIRQPGCATVMEAVKLTYSDLDPRARADVRSSFITTTVREESQVTPQGHHQ